MVDDLLERQHVIPPPAMEVAGEEEYQVPSIQDS